jgi:hypothetical protein
MTGDEKIHCTKHSISKCLLINIHLYYVGDKMKFSPYKKNFVIRIVALFIIMSNSLVVNASLINRHTQNQVQAQDKMELNVIIMKPAKGHLYINDEDQGNTTTGVTRIIGSITIEASVTGGEGGIDRVEFFIDGINRNTTNDLPYAWLWNDTYVGAATIKVTAFDTAGNESSRSLDVRVIMINEAGIKTMTVAESMMAKAVARGNIRTKLASFLILNSNNLATYKYQSNPNNLLTIKYS